MRHGVLIHTWRLKAYTFPIPAGFTNPFIHYLERNHSVCSPHLDMGIIKKNFVKKVPALMRSLKIITKALSRLPESRKVPPKEDRGGQQVQNI
jgi:hypothetical protein